MKRKILYILIGFLLIILIIFFINFNSYYLVLIGKEKEIKIPVNENDNFIISFKHSVALTYVYEYYKIYKNKIILYEMDFYDQCAGLPTEVFNEEKFIMENGKFKIINMRREFKTINYGINSNYDFKLFIQNKEFNLSDIFKTEKVVISLRRRLWLIKI